MVDIELPRQNGESTKAHQARIEYVTMGAGRSLDKLRQKYGRNPAYTRHLERWSSQYGWVVSAEQYDEACASITMQQASAQHQADLAAFRTRCAESGRALYSVSVRLLKLFDTRLQSGLIEIGPGTLQLVANAFKTALDLEATALRVEELLEAHEDEYREQ